MSQHLDNLREIRRRLVERRRELGGWAVDDTEIDQGEAYGKTKKYNQENCLKKMLEVQEKIEALDKIIDDEMRP